MRIQARRAERPVGVPSAKEIYEQLSVGLTKPLAELGYWRAKSRSFPSWRAATDGVNVFVSVQVDRNYADYFAGNRFRLESEKGAGSEPNMKLTGRALFFQLLRSEEIDRLLDVQNRVIASLQVPPESYVAPYPQEVRDQFMSQVKPQDDFDVVRCWLRVRSLDDIEGWVKVIAELLPTLDARAREALDAGELQLGRGRLITNA